MYIVYNIPIPRLLHFCFVRLEKISTCYLGLNSHTPNSYYISPYFFISKFYIIKGGREGEKYDRQK